MFRDLYHKHGISLETLSREIEDTDTITSPPAPWNSCGTYMPASLAYLQFCFFNLINVAISFMYALFGFQNKHAESEKERAHHRRKSAYMERAIDVLNLPHQKQRIQLKLEESIESNQFTSQIEEKLMERHIENGIVLGT